MADLVTRWLRTSGNSLSDFDGLCLELADEVSKSLSSKGVTHGTLWLDSVLGDCEKIVGHYPGHKEEWYYHVVILVGEFVHDAWLGKRMKIEEYFASVFPGQRLAMELRDESGRVVRVGTWKNSIMRWRRGLR